MMHVLSYNLTLYVNFFSIFHRILCTYYLVSVSYLNVEKYKYFPKTIPLFFECVCLTFYHTYACMHAHVLKYTEVLRHTPLDT
jgi:hypothetical protein